MSYPLSPPSSLRPITRIMRRIAWRFTERDHRPMSNPFAPTFVRTSPLAGTQLACRWCGVAVPREEQGEVTVYESHGRLAAPGAAQLQGLASVEFASRMTRCAACAERRTEAERLVRVIPFGRLNYGSERHAIGVVEQALAAAALLDMRVSISTARQLAQFVEILTPVGALVAWAGRFAPVADHDARPDTAATLAWSHVSEEQRQEARQAFTRWLALKIERPAEIAPPVGRGCYACGIGSITSLPSQASDAWRIAKIRPEAFGGHSFDMVEAVFCRDCAAEYDHLGAWGQTMLGRLVLRAAGVERHRVARDAELTVRAWGTLPGSPGLNATPFAHLDLVQLRADLDTGFAR